MRRNVAHGMSKRARQLIESMIVYVCSQTWKWLGTYLYGLIEDQNTRARKWQCEHVPLPWPRKVKAASICCRSPQGTGSQRRSMSPRCVSWPISSFARVRTWWDIQTDLPLWIVVSVSAEMINRVRQLDVLTSDRNINTTNDSPLYPRLSTLIGPVAVYSQVTKRSQIDDCVRHIL